MDWVAADAGQKAITPIWQELVVGTVAFAILCYVLMKYVFPRMEQTFDARVKAIDGGIKRAEAARADAGQLLQRYRAELAEAHDSAARIRDHARADAEGIRQEVLAEARQESDRIIAAGRDRLVAERQTIVLELRAEVGTLAAALASKIVGEPLADEARRNGTVERFLTELESAEATEAGRQPDPRPGS